MKALVFAAKDQAQVVELEQPSIGPDEVLIRSHAVGICHSDFELLEGRYIIPFSYPITPGHEWAGEVVETGAAVNGLRPGDRVVGECVVGPLGATTSDSTSAAPPLNTSRPRGEWLHKVPESLDYTKSALVEPFSVAYHAVRCLGGVDPSDTIAVLAADRSACSLYSRPRRTKRESSRSNHKPVVGRSRSDSGRPMPSIRPRPTFAILSPRSRTDVASTRSSRLRPRRRWRSP